MLQNRKVGDSSTHNGVEFTPTKYVLTDSLMRVYGRNKQKLHTESGAVFLLTHLSVVHNGDSEQEFPTTGPSGDAIDLYYKGERVDDGGMRDDITERYIVEGKKLQTYRNSLYENDATSGVYPGKKVDGWVFNKIAENFSPSELQLHVVWNQQAFTNEGETVDKWAYTEDAEVSIEEVEGEGRTISL
ncbi:hypothetical protein NGM07_24550 (plasmid) [Halorussus vallis]|nr:hypothetical protein [Halorussus vallis]USZ78684.1 hypothetical protein NGM07_24550 [Halorussus vallis]